MSTVTFVIASMLPALLLGIRAVIFRRLPRLPRLALDLGILLVSVPAGMWLLAVILHFPSNAGDHNPGIGVAFALLFLVSLACFAIWLARAAILAFQMMPRPD